MVLNSPGKNLTNSVFLPRTYQSFSLIRREKLLHIPIHDPEQDRREVDPSLCQAPLEHTALYDRVDVFPQSVDVCLAGEYPPVLGGLKLN